MARNYHTMDVYHLAYNFALEMYTLTKQFPSSEEQNIISQLRRASVSIPLNIVEGSARASSREFTYHLNVAYSSAKEVEVLLKLSFDLGYLSEENFQRIFTSLDRLNAKLYLFLRTMESRTSYGKYKFFQKFEEELEEDSIKHP